ncbi:citrulline utilization hydrolase CtlX [Fulvivirgaceae bacterium LMO-SS25]
MSQQAPKTIMMVRPASFGPNPETEGSNIFQAKASESAELIIEKAQAEFDVMAQKIIENGIDLIQVEDTPEPIKTDAVFPNNWISTHSDGKVVFYPMLSTNRRFERRVDILQKLESLGHPISELLDISKHEKSDIYLEGTGSIVFDYDNKLAFACSSSRSNKELFYELCMLIDVEPIWFDAKSPNGGEIYHTNVILSIGEKYIVIADELIPSGDRILLMAKLSTLGKEIISINFQQVCSFAGNIIEVKNRREESHLLMSSTAWQSFTPEQKLKLEAKAKILTLDIPTIEKYGGGSVRCMVCGIFN